MSSQTPESLCGERVGQSTVTFPCTLDRGHPGPHYAIENVASVAARQRWEGAQRHEASPLAAFQGPAQTTAERYTDNATPAPQSESVLRADAEAARVLRTEVGDVPTFVSPDMPEGHIAVSSRSGVVVGVDIEASEAIVHFADGETERVPLTRIEETVAERPVYQVRPIIDIPGSRYIEMQVHLHGTPSITQARNLGEVEVEARSLIAVTLDVDPDSFDVEILPPVKHDDVYTEVEVEVPAPTKQRPGDQPLPTGHTDQVDIQTLVIADIEARRQVGIERYGQALLPFNGRSTLLDAYEEALDLTVYLRSLLEMQTRTLDRLLDEAADQIHKQNPGISLPTSRSMAEQVLLHVRDALALRPEEG